MNEPTDEERKKHYETDGFRFLPCILATNAKFRNTFVKEGKEILILKTEEGFEIRFLNKHNKYERKIIPKEYEDLSLKLNNLYRSNLENESIYFIEDNELTKHIYELVSSFEGKTRKICREANRICYIAGLFFKALEIAESKKIPVSESLFNMQFKLKKDLINFNQILKNYIT